MLRPKAELPEVQELELSPVSGNDKAITGVKFGLEPNGFLFLILQIASDHPQGKYHGGILDRSGRRIGSVGVELRG